MLPDRESEAEKRLREILREARLKADLRQSDLAEILGQGQSFVSKYESGERLLTFTEALFILERLGASGATAANRVKATFDGAKS
jgi:transcriptional regulator with XRE-family HTH domain